jgi:hypothetical protein
MLAIYKIMKNKFIGCVDYQSLKLISTFKWFKCSTYFLLSNLIFKSEPK